MPRAAAENAPPVSSGPRRKSGVVVPNAPSRLQSATAVAVAAGMRLLGSTLRFRVQPGGDPSQIPSEPVIFALWHNRLGLCMKIYQRYVQMRENHTGLAALISASKDGALLAAILHQFGVKAVRGSSSRRGPQALLELASLARRGYDVAVTPDGPRGPRYVVQQGVLMLAQTTGLPIVPYSCRLRWKVRLKSWDRFELPLPFSRCDVYFGAPIRVPRDISDSERTEIGWRLQAALLKGSGDE